MKSKEQLIKSAYYEGGKKAMDEFIQKNLKYPALALEKKVEGKVHLLLDIDKKGKVVKVKVVVGVGFGCDEEAMRVVKMMQFKVENLRNMHVIYHHKLTINFKLPTPKPVVAQVEPEMPTPAMSLQYTVVSATPKQTTPAEQLPAVTVYTYTV
jgi:TonB family protein